MITTAVYDRVNNSEALAINSLDKIHSYERKEVYNQMDG